MLRRKPTALTISPEDLQSLDTHLARQKAYIHFQKTGQDPNGWFSQSRQGSEGQEGGEEGDDDWNGNGNGRDGGHDAKGGRREVDPNDELKPLPGDKARIVRGREERIMGGR